MNNCKIIAIANAKGGTGKTTSSINFGAALAERGLRVLLIDNDPERHLSNALGLSTQKVKYTLSNLMSAALNEMDMSGMLDQCILQAGKLHCIPSNNTLAGMALQLAVKQSSAMLFDEQPGVKSEFALKHVTDSVRHLFDYIIIDCGPSHDLLTINALAAANQVIIPVQAHYMPEEGLYSFIEVVRKIRMSLNPDLEIGGILITMYQGATNLCRGVQQDIQEKFGEDFRVFRQPIAHSIRVAESPAFKVPVLEHDPSNQASQGYHAMASEVLENAKT